MGNVAPRRRSGGPGVDQIALGLSARTGRGLASPGDETLARALAGARVRVRALAVDRQAAAVPQAAVAAEVHQALDVHLDLAAQVALDLVVGVEHVTDLLDLRLRELLGALGGGDARLGADAARRSL